MWVLTFFHSKSIAFSIENIRIVAYGYTNDRLFCIHVSDRTNQCDAKEFVDMVLFHAAVSKHENIVKMLYCQTQRTPLYFILEASIPGNLLHFLWSLREVKLFTESLHMLMITDWHLNLTLTIQGRPDNLQAFSERSVYTVAKQVATGLVSTMYHVDIYIISIY